MLQTSVEHTCHTDKIGLDNQLGKIKVNTFTKASILGTKGGFLQYDLPCPKEQSEKYTKGSIVNMEMLGSQKQVDSPHICKNNREAYGNQIGSFSHKAENLDIIEVKKSEPSSRMGRLYKHKLESGRGNQVVDRQYKQLEWKSNDNMATTKGDNNRCIISRMGSMDRKPEGTRLVVNPGKEIQQQCKRVTGRSLWTKIFQGGLDRQGGDAPELHTKDGRKSRYLPKMTRTFGVKFVLLQF